MNVETQYATNNNGIGNIYKFWGEWKDVVCAITKGWEHCFDHPAQLHYGLDYTGKDLNKAINKSAFEAFDLLQLDLRGTNTILDAGCGVGGISFNLAKRYPDQNFVGITAVANQCETAKKRSLAAKLENTAYFHGDFLETSFPDDTFDGIIGIETFVYIGENSKPKLFRELKRILKPGGRIAIYDGYIAEGDVSTFRNFHEYGGIASGWALPTVISNVEQLRKHAQGAGLEIELVEEITPRIMGSAREIKKRAMLFYLPILLFSFLARLGITFPFLAKMGFHKSESLLFQKTCYLQHSLYISGEVKYYRICLKKPNVSILGSEL